jgi:hypothetical protein
VSRQKVFFAALACMAAMTLGSMAAVVKGVDALTAPAPPRAAGLSTDEQRLTLMSQRNDALAIALARCADVLDRVAAGATVPPGEAAALAAEANALAGRMTLDCEGAGQCPKD